MTRAEILRRLPHASKSFLERNAEDHPAALPADNPQPTEGRSLQRVSKRKKASSHSPVQRIGLAFTVYAVRPADADGWDFKEIIDALVGAKILDGDGWDQLFIAGVHSEKVHSKDQERTEISIIYQTQKVCVSAMDRAVLIEQFWNQCGGAWNRPAFDAFMDTLSTDDLRNYITVGKE